jgi:hypothetical protein
MGGLARIAVGGWCGWHHHAPGGSILAGNADP